MGRNIEIKARIESVDALMPRVVAIADQGPIDIFQDDTFFACTSGRLKLRSFSATEGELIFYQRPNQQGPKESFYLLSPTSSPDNLRELLSLAYGQVGRVKKHRTLFLIGRTRIHLDRVSGLGEFLELELVLEDNQASHTGVLESRELMAKLGVQPSQFIDTSYVDLITACEHSSPKTDVPWRHNIPPSTHGTPPNSAAVHPESDARRATA
jgi:predicted adenylyl cyclase CyaB